MKSSPDKSAEQRFRDAFDRLKKGNPKVLPYGTPVTQNNVAKEAGLTQGALRKSRFPLLIAEIQQYVGTHDQKRPSTRQQVLAQRAKNRKAREVIDDLRAQHDKAIGLLVDADARILELTHMLADRDAQIEDWKHKATVTTLPEKVPKDMVRILLNPSTSDVANGATQNADKDAS